MSSNKYYIIKTDSDEIEYILEEMQDEPCYILSHSNSESWSKHIRGTEVVRCINTGDGVKFTWKEKVKNMYFDYSQLYQMNILTNFLNAESHMPNRYAVLSTNPYISV